MLRSLLLTLAVVAMMNPMHAAVTGKMSPPATLSHQVIEQDDGSVSAVLTIKPSAKLEKLEVSLNRLNEVELPKDHPRKWSFEDCERGKAVTML